LLLLAFSVASQSSVQKTLERSVALECYVNIFGRRALREVEGAYREMLIEMVDYAVEHNASQETLHRVFYRKFTGQYPWLPTRIIKGAYRDAVRRARSFRVLKRKGKAHKDKPEIRSITIVYSDSQDWRLENGVLKVKTHRGWVTLRYGNNKLLHRYLYGGWRLSGELKLKFIGGRIIAYLTFKRVFNVEYNPLNVVAVDVNENNVTMALFKDAKLIGVYRIETGLGNMVIAYAERRRKITQGNSTKDREVRKRLRRLREKARKRDVLSKTVKAIEELAKENNAIVVIGKITEKAKEEMEEGKGKRLRHRIHQWAVRGLTNMLSDKPIQVVEISEKGTSSHIPFSGRRIKHYRPLVIRNAVRGLGNPFRIRVMKIKLRIAVINGVVWERDEVGAVNLGLKYLKKILKQMGGVVAYPSTGAHEVWVKLMNPHQGPTHLVATINLNKHQ
jgi:IS605 OrfB family transposase